MAAFVFAAAAAARGGAALPAAKAAAQMPKGQVLAGIAVIGFVAGVTVPWGLANVAVESLGIGGWIRGTAFAAVALAAPVVAGMALAANVAVLAFARIWGRAADRPRSRIALVSGLVLVAATILALQTALGLVFDPRYRDFTYAPLTAAAVPFLVVSLLGRRGAGARGRAETVAAVTLAGSAVYIVLNESLANWQAVWFAAVLAVLAVTLDRLRDAQST